MVLYFNDIDQSIFKAANQVMKEKNRFEDLGIALFKTTILQSIDYGKSLLSNDRNKYTKALA